MIQIPDELLISLQGLRGFDKAAFVDAHQPENKITSVRLNPFKKPAGGPDFKLNNAVPWASDAYYLDTRPNFTFDPFFHAGAYYVQEAGSMFLEWLLKATVNFSEQVRALDLCAAPGGKSTLINSLITADSLLVANELIRNRAEILSQNLGKWGTNNTVVTNADVSKFSALNGFFDLLVIDAPCSGSGLFRKQPEAIAEWSTDSVILCSNRQKTILSDALPCLKENGVLIYSTCSYSVAENEDMVDWLIAEQGLEYIPLEVAPEWGIITNDKGFRFYPHLAQSEGFFCAALRKKKAEDPVYLPKKHHLVLASKAEHGLLSAVIREQGLPVIKKNNQFHLLNEAAQMFLNAFDKQFYFKKAGCVIGEIKGKDLVPNHDLALSNDVSGRIQRIYCDKDNSLKFLMKENFSVDEMLKGFSLVTYKDAGLGWAKTLPNRVNNYLPNELRILSRKP